jgi:YVTN family beta-propeller protein
MGCLVFLCVSALTVSGCTLGTPAEEANAPPTTAATRTYKLYVADSGTNDVSIIDASGNVIKTIPVGKSPSAIGLDAEPGNVPTHVYIANKGDNTVTVLNVADNSVAATIPVGLSPSAIAFMPIAGTNDEIFVVNSGDGTVSRINVVTLSVTATYKVGHNPIAIGLGSEKFGVLNADDATITVFSDTLQNTTATTLIPVQGTPIGLSLISGDFIAVTADGRVQLFKFNGNTGYDAQPVINTGAAAQRAIPLGATDWALINSQNGTVALYSGFYKKITKTLTAGTAPIAADFADNPNGTGILLFVPNKGSDNISVYAGNDFDASMTAKTPIALEKGAQPVAIGHYDFWTGGASPTPSPNGSAAPTPTPTPTPIPTPTATPTTPPTTSSHVYIANYGAGNVAQYAPPFSNTSVPTATFGDTTPVGGPVGIAANATYIVTSHITGSAYAYRQPVSASSTPIATFGGSAFGLMTFDAQGNLWATSQNSSVVEYVPPFTNSTTESKDLTNGFTSSYGIAFDASGNLYVSNSDSSANIVVYAPPYTSVSNTYANPTPNARLHGIAVNGSNLYVADTFNNLIYIYTLPMSTNIPADMFSATAPLGLAFDANGTLYVTSQGTNQVQVFNPPFNSGSRPAATITSGVNRAFGIAAGP